MVKLSTLHFFLLFLSTSTEHGDNWLIGETKAKVLCCYGTLCNHSEFYRTIPCSLSVSISEILSPSCSPSISFVCCPSVGGAVRAPGWLCEYFTGVFTIFIGPQLSCSISTTMSRAIVCSCVSVPCMSLTAAYGRPLPSKVTSHSSVVLCFVNCSIFPSRSWRFATLSGLVLYLGSSFH